MGTMVSQITSLMIISSTVYSCADQRKHQSSASLAFVRENSPVAGKFPAQTASNAENFAIWWCHHAWLLITWWRKGIAYNWTLGNQFQWNFNRNLNIFFKENGFMDLKMTSAESRPFCFGLNVLTVLSYNILASKLEAYVPWTNQ